MSCEHPFTGFYKETFVFLRSLEKNNNKKWFDQHKNNYHDFLLNPLKSLVSNLSGFMLTIDPYFEVSPAVNRTISRIYRDTRFTKDKSPYKTTSWITFKRPKKDWKDSPAYFLELSPHSYRFGMGLYSASPNTMRGFRDAIDEKVDDFLQAISFYPKQKMFEIEGSQYKKVINKHQPADIQEWYQRRNLYIVCNRKIDKCLFSSKFVDNLRFGFKLLEPFYHYLWRTKS